MAPLLPPDPPLEDGVIRVRARRDSDRDAVIAACRAPDIPRWTLVPEDYGPEHWEAWQAEAARQAEAGVGLHMVIADGADELIGAVGINSIDAETGSADIGYWVAPWGRGRGAAARAARLVHDWAIAELGLRELTLIIHRDNVRSQRVAQAAGFVDSGRRAPCPRAACSDEDDHIVFVRPS